MNYAGHLSHSPGVGAAAYAARGDLLAFLEGVVVPFNGDECLIWPFFRERTGYARIKFGGKRYSVHRVVCEREHGPAPTPKHVAAHSCGKGHLGCVNRKHLRWATYKENEDDKIAHGTDTRGERHRSAKLTEQDVLAIRSSNRRGSHLAREFGVTKETVSKIRRRRIWAWLEDAA